MECCLVCMGMTWLGGNGNVIGQKPTIPMNAIRVSTQ